jgi:hypothetical protein
MTASLVEPISATTRSRRPTTRPVSRDWIAWGVMSAGIVMGEKLLAISSQCSARTISLQRSAKRDAAPSES